MFESLSLVLATAILVSLRAIQQQNVLHKYYTHAAITSFLMAFAEVTVIVTVVSQGFSSAIYVGAGGAIGVCFAMWFHPKYIQKNNKDK